ncbi:MAG: tripartite tricarboxylate transporter substrate binding protein [Burkholderiales bacterium]|nr:tripartite tricarboxylate transporter substrate binding protein [Burkholderiales bacterium]
MLNRRLALSLALASLSSQLLAQGDKLLRFVVLQPPGNVGDGIVRKLSLPLQKEMGQTIVVENLPGAGGLIGIAKVTGTPAEQLPVLMLGSQSETILSPYTVPGTKYKPEDLRAVAMVASAPMILATRPDLPASNVEELLALARKTPGKPLTCGNIGPGSIIHVVGEMWARKAGIPLSQVPYKGGAPMVQDLLSGQIDLSFLPLGGPTLPMIETGKLRALGITSAATSPRLPKVLPLEQQSAAFKDFNYETWAAVFVPRLTPEALVQRIHQALAVSVKDTDLQTYIVGGGSDPAPAMTLAQLDRWYQQEIRTYQTMAREAGLKVS